MQNIPITNEQEAAVAVLFASAMTHNKTIKQQQIEQLSRMLVLSSKFKSCSLNDLAIQALSLQAAHGSKALIEHCAPLISSDFKETLFAMCCEVITADGRIDENETEMIAWVALHLGTPSDTMKMMLTTYLIRNRWNVQIVEQE